MVKRLMRPHPIVESLLACPHCGFASIETMPTDACVFFHECANCHELLRPKPGDCCIYCSYGSVKCPSMQPELSCCDGGVPKSSG